jgi:branched-subunit amino acid ABC-type transport system permease component
MDVVRFALNGLGTGALIALAAQGLIVTYRASGVVNFAQGAIGMAGAFVFYDLRDRYDVPWLAAIVLGILAGAVLGAASHLLVMRPLRRASPLVRLIATLGLLTIIQNAFTLRYGADQKLVKGVLPTSSRSGLRARVQHAGDLPEGGGRQACQREQRPVHRPVRKAVIMTREATRELAAVCRCPR